jgi:hypothetical protein
MKGFDSFAGVVKSGGKTRRAAKMVILDVDESKRQLRTNWFVAPRCGSVLFRK